MPEKKKKSSFTRTCSLLSQYLREKRSLGEIASRSHEHMNQGILSAHPATMNLLAGLQTERAEKAIGLFKQPETEEEAKRAQLTIFYDGKVLLFDDFPEDKAKDLVQLAAKGSCTTTVSSPEMTDRSLSSTSDSKPTQLEAVPGQANADLPMPIARRASLHRFLAKRKDRIVSKAPYQQSEVSWLVRSGPSDSGKPEEVLSWLGFDADQTSRDHPCET